MSSIEFVGGTIITPQETRFCSLRVTDGLISAIGWKQDQQSPDFEQFDVSDCYITPGLIDLQLNVGPRCDFWGDPDEKDVLALSEDLLKGGVTTILPTLITDGLDHLKKNIEFLKSLGVGTADRVQLSKEARKAGVDSSRVRLPGIHLEGPCLSPKRPGVHPPQHIRPLTVETLAQICDDAVCLITVAPETAPSDEALAYLLKSKIKISLGHSNATFEEASKAFNAGVKLITHTFNALPAVHHRAPGAVTAALLDDSVTCAIICDGLHVSPEAVKLVLKVKSKERMLLVTDAAHIGTTGGGLVGSSINLDEAVRNVVNWNVASFADAIRMATLNPAQVLGLQDSIGQIALNNVADLVIWEKESLRIKHVFLGGRKVF